MTEHKHIDVLIVGSGPAGMSTALHLVQADPSWGGRVMVVDKAVHPREKLCGGGVTQLGMQVLDNLGLSIETPNVPVSEVRMVYQHLAFAIRDETVFRVVRRDEFDHWLAWQGEQQGIVVRQGEAVVGITPGANVVDVVTNRGAYRAGVVVAADGARSFVRQKLRWGGNGQLARLLEVLTPENADQQFEFRDGVAVFDFSPMAAGLQGYYWDFPSLIRGQAFMNRGVFDSRVRPERPRVPLKETLRAQLSARQRRLENYSLKGHPIHWFDPQARFARPRILLAGDAAGVDPLLGEGISFALAYGQVAAEAIVDAFAHHSFDFTDYKSRILAHPILSQLKMRAWLARMVYRFDSPRLLGGLWRMAPLLVRLLAWYNRQAVPVSQPRLERIQ